MKKLNIEQYRKAVAKGKLKDPLIFLDGIMNGEDLTEKSALYEFISELEGLPTEDEFDYIVKLVRLHLKYDAVKVSDRLRAAERLAEYLHPKLKTEEKASSRVESDDSFTPLKEEEIILLREKFNELY